jgi:type I restriction enzyme S subunit
MSKQTANDWRTEPLGKHCGWITKGTTPTSVGRNFTQHGVTFIKAESILETGKIDPARTAFIDAETHSLLTRSQLASGDLLISIAGVLGRVGKFDDSNPVLCEVSTNGCWRCSFSDPAAMLAKWLGTPVISSCLDIGRAEII